MHADKQEVLFDIETVESRVIGETDLSMGFFFGVSRFASFAR